MENKQSNLDNKLLVLDTSYSLEDIKKRGMIQSVTCRDLDGYFSHVYTVHPFASIVTSIEWSKKYGKPDWHEINSSHTFIEGKVGRFSFLKFIFPLNFLFSQLNLVYDLSKLIRKEKIGVIRVGDMLYLGLFGWFLSKLFRVPFVIRVGGNHDKIFESTGQPIQKRLFFNRKIEKKIEKFIFPRAHLIAAVNKDNLDFSIANGAKKEHSTIFRYGNLLDENHFVLPENRKEGLSLLKEHNLLPKSFLICIGRLEKVKHPEEIIKVLANVRKKGHDVKAVLVGDGTMKEELLKLSKELGVENYVVFVGNRDQDWLSRVLPLSGVVISPLTGRALSEASLALVPVVAYDIDWQGELIENEKTGFLVPYLDLEKFSTVTARCLEENEFAEKMAINLRNRAMDMLDPKKLNQNEINHYNALKKRFFK